MNVIDQLHAPAAFPWGTDLHAHLIGGWVDHRAGIGDMLKCKSNPGSSVVETVP
jgi:hypothetical protein